MAPKLDCRLESLVSFLKYKFQLKLTEHTHLYVETARVKWCVERVQSVCTCMDNSSEEASKRVFRRRHTALLYYSSVVCVCFTVCMHYLFKILFKKKKKQ